MAAKINFKDLLLQKGEKFLLVAAAGLFALLLVWGVVAMASAGNPQDNAKKLTDNAKNVSVKLAASGDPVPDPPILTVGSIARERVPPDQFAVRTLPFEAVEWPNTRRESPRVLTPVESQVDLVQGPVAKLAYDFVELNGDLKEVKVLVNTQRQKGAVDRNAIGGIFKPDGKKRRPAAMQQQPQPGTGGPGGTSPAGSGGVSPKGGGMVGPGGVPGMPGAPGGGLSSGTAATEEVLTWVSLAEAEKNGQLPVLGVVPTRMAVVQLSFPLREQLEEIKRALRLRTIEQAIAESGPSALTPADPKTGLPLRQGAAAPAGGPTLPGVGGTGAAAAAGGAAGVAPVFDGFVVQRRITREGETGPWEAFDHEAQWYNEFKRYEAPFLQDGGWLPYFLRPEQDMATPLPVIPDKLALNYPPTVRLSTIFAAKEKLERANKQPLKADEILARFKMKPGGEGGVFSTGGGGLGGSVPGLGGDGMGSEGFGGSGSFGPRGMGPGGRNIGGGGIGGNPMNPVNAPTDALDSDYLLMRFLDTEMVPGYTYEYRVRVRIKNPNFGKYDKVATESAANKQILEEPDVWHTVAPITVPDDKHTFAFSTKDYDRKAGELIDPFADKSQGDKGQQAAAALRLLTEQRDVREGRKTVVQVQKWVDQVLFEGNLVEKIGAWVQAEMPVGPGEFIGKRTFVELPLWRPTQGAYVLNPPKGSSAKPIIPNWPDKLPQPNGRPVDFRTRNVLIDFDGGRTQARVGGTTVSDDAESDLLILREDGRVEVRSETADRGDAQREAREKAWDEWQKRVRARSSAVATTGTGPTTGGNGR